MNLGRIVCAIRGHDWTRWRTIKQTDAYLRHLVAAMTVVDGVRPNSVRRCKRCGKEETKPVRTPAQRNRAANAADTIQKETP